MRFLERALRRFSFHMIQKSEKDPKKLKELQARNKSLKKSALQSSFAAENEEEDNAEMLMLLKHTYKTNAMARTAMDTHIKLLDTIAATDTIKEIEKHMRKSLKQIRALMTEVVMQRKLRSEIRGTNFIAAPLSKPPNLDEVRNESRRINIGEF